MFEQIVARPEAPYVAAGIALVIVALVVWRFLSRRRASGGVAGEDLGALIRQLRKTNAQWETIMAALNPRNDSVISGLLKDLRGPHMFVPHTALNIIEDAFLFASRTKPRANVRDVLMNARGSMNKVTKYGD